jgi:hypothetical protein
MTRPTGKPRGRPRKVPAATAAKIAAIKGGADHAQAGEAQAAADFMAQATSDGNGSAPLTPDQLDPRLQSALLAATGSPRPAASKRDKKFDSLQVELTALLCLPAIPFEAAKDTYCANHFVTMGPRTSETLVAHSETHPATLKALERVVEAGGMILVATALASYLMPPILYHTDAPKAMKSMFSVPDKPQKETTE